jgi:hypothetical protein
MSGVGKSTLLEGLAGRGYTYAVLDTDYDGWVLADGRAELAQSCYLQIIASDQIGNQGCQFLAYSQ